MERKNYVVTVYGKIAVDTTVAVVAESEGDAARIALRGLHDDTEEWLHNGLLLEDPVATAPR